MIQINGGVCAAKGFSASGVHCGIRHNKTKRDLALIADEKLTCAEIEDVLMHSCKYVTAAKLFDVYRGGQIPEGKKSVAFSVYLRSADSTLTDKEIEDVSTKIIKKLESIGAELRK